ncbi:ricin-type beta-trefoil lectin domain protein [uncultured Paraglaciecola sp.]|uniref:ricin-type beta-trefoil lectin domain protein n=1 Tax=uncultured Paraglaciecola sp. TaxID=1765024 RepID=UPI0030D92BF1|tara:strand:- start:103599 stop:104045 length:447 start_codon:yes stop_codon:yes gene_type:complete
MKNLILKSLFVLSVISVLLSAGAQAANFNKLMQLGIIGSNTSGKEVVIYNEDQSKCLSSNGQKSNGSKGLAYTTCRIDGTDTWLITSGGKVKNKQSGKCLSTPAGKDSLVLVHCNYMHIRDYAAHDLVILDHLVDSESEGVEVADARY